MAKNKNNKNTPWEFDAQSLQYLGLEKQPYAEEILTEQTFFQSQALLKILESLIHQVQFSDLLLIVEGKQGSGKTSIYRQFIQTDITNTKILSVQAEATDTLAQLQQKMSLHLQDLGDANHLEDNLKSLQTFDQVPVLVMDNSHVLSDTTLQELFRFQQELLHEQDVTLKVLLFANSGMSDTLQKITDISAEQMYVQHMPELTPKQVERFLFHKLRQAGYKGEKILDEKSLSQIIKKSDGSLVSLMQVSVPFIEKIVAKKLKPGINIPIRLILLLIGISLVAAAGAWLYLNLIANQPESQDLPITPPQTSLSPDAGTDNVDTPTAEIETDTDPFAPESETAEIQPTALPPEKTAKQTPPQISPESTSTSEAQIAENVSQKIASEARSANPAIVSKPVLPAPEISQPTTSQSDARTRIGSTTSNEQAVVSSVPDKTPEKPADKPSAVSSPAPIQSVTPEPQQSKPAAPLHSALKQLNTLGIKDASWVKQQPDSHWTLQLLGAREPETLLKFVRRHHLSGQAAWYKTWLKGKPYYVLIHGSFSSRDAARNAIARLSPALRANKPWVKSMKSVKLAAR